MAKDILTAKVAIVRFGAIEIEGLLFDDGRYGVAVPQIAKVFPYFQDSQEKASQTPSDAIDWAQEVTGLPRNVLIEEFATLPNDGKKAVAWVSRVTAIKK